MPAFIPKQLLKLYKLHCRTNWWWSTRFITALCVCINCSKGNLLKNKINTLNNGE